MGKRNDRRRRQARARARQRDRSTRKATKQAAAGSRAGAAAGLHRDAASNGGGRRAFTPDLVDGVVAAAVSAVGAHDGRALDNAVAVLTRGPVGADRADGPVGHAVVDQALGRHLVEAVGNAWGRGWQPTDLVRVVERELGRAHGRLAAVAVVHETARYEPASVPPRWRAQVDDLAPARARRNGSSGRSGPAPGANGHGQQGAGPAGTSGAAGPAPGANGHGQPGGGPAGTSGPTADALDGGGGSAGTSGATGGPSRGGDVGGDGRWAVAGQGGDRGAAIRTAVEILALVGRLPAVPKLGPAPGDAPRASGLAGEGAGRADPRMLHRVRSLLAKAESTTFPEEAEALTAKAQELMARHAIDTAVLDAERGTGPDVAARRLAVDDPYAAPKAILLDAIASANRCRSVWSKGYGYATVFGAEGDLDAVELLYTSLLVQAARAMLSEKPAPTGGPRAGGRTRSFRQSFLVAFATRIGIRLREAVEAATDAYADEHDNLLPVLAERRDAADAACDEAFPRVRATSVSANDWWGWQAGNEAAEAAQLDLHTPVGRATS